jgi:hypothetical protein
MMNHPDALIASDYVICATLRKVPDVFNVELLWEQRIRGGQEGMFLLEALKRYPRTPRRRQDQEIRYSHVIVRIPERDYVRDDRLEEGFSRRALLRELRRLHQQEWGSFLAEPATIRYRVEPDATLRPGEVRFLFGRAIYLPADEEAPIFQIQATLEGQNDWWEVGLIYPGQRLTLLNGDRRASSFAVAAWPFPSGESVLLIVRPGVPNLVDVEAEPPGCLDLTDEGDEVFMVRDRRGRALRLRVAALAAAGEVVSASAPAIEEPAAGFVAPKSRLTANASAVRPDALVAEPEAESEPVISALDQTCPLVDPWGRREPVLGFAFDFAPPSAPVALAPAADWPTSPPTFVEPPAPAPEGQDQYTWIPQRPAVYLRVMGVALQRLSTYAAVGISDWRISFNRAGGLVPEAHPEAAAWLRIDSADRLFGEVVGHSALLELPGWWRPFPELAMELHAASPPMTAHYLGWVSLPAPLALPVPRERAVSFGRGSQADLAPRLLADPRALRWGGSPARSDRISAEYLGLSRRHLSVQARRDDWWVQLESRNMPAYRLTPSGELLDVLEPGANTAMAAKPGELLVAGGYVLALGEIE